MKAARNICIFLTFLTISNLCIGQDDLAGTFYNQFDIEEQKTSYKQYTSGSNEMKQVASAFFLLYKEFISSQDVDACVFTPSCSVYAMESIKEYGLAVGLVNAFDRMTRCHPFAGEHYHRHPVTHKNHDPVEKKR